MKEQESTKDTWGGQRDGAGRKPIKDKREIKRMYRFNHQEAGLIDKAVNLLKKQNAKLVESEFVRTTLLKEAEKILKKAKIINK